MNDLQERLDLSAGRLSEILRSELSRSDDAIREKRDAFRQGIHAGTQKAGFWRDAAALLLGEGRDDRWLDYACCRETFGSHTGVYLGLLYAQCWLAAALAGDDQLSSVEKEVLCVTREAILLIYGQSGCGSTAEDIRDSLYWF